jgi:hypothetical protein
VKIGFSFGILYLALMGAIACAQSYRGEALSVEQRAAQVEFFRLRFLTFTFGREGPMDAPLSTTPVMGREYFVEADLSGIESAANIRFELLDAAGRPLQALTMWKASDSSTDGEFYGFITVPNQPFRAAVIGTTTNGAALRFVLDTLFQPAADGPPDQPILPPGIPANEIDKIQGIVNLYRQQLRTRAAQAAIDHPGGVIALPRTVVSPIAYEPLVSASGDPIGIRLRYTIRFPSQQTITAVPHVFPVYQETAWRGIVTMKPLNGTIIPTPQTAGVQSLREVIVYQAPATYQAGVTYTFTVDMAPDFVFQGTRQVAFAFTNRSSGTAPCGTSL